MEVNTVKNYIKYILENMPKGWLSTTTHRLDIYNEALAKTEFLEQFENLFNNNNTNATALNNLPTAYDYIRLGHPLSCVLEWVIAKQNKLNSDKVISFSSAIAPILAVLRKNVFENKNTHIYYSGELHLSFESEIIEKIYGYTFKLIQINTLSDIPKLEGSTIYISQENTINQTNLTSNIDFYIHQYSNLGSVLLVNGEQNENYISEIQHVRRRETIAMTPANCFTLLQANSNNTTIISEQKDTEIHKKNVLDTITSITNSPTKPLVSSSGLSIQYAILMGLIHYAQENYPGKAIKFVVPPNCYGGTNDQARRVAACLDNVEVMDLPVDGGNDMVKSIDKVVQDIALQDAIPFIIAEIPTNPRVEVPNLTALKNVLSEARKTTNGTTAIAPVFILDQTFCPNVHFLGDTDILSDVKTISFASGSKFPSGGKCTAGYCVGNKKTETIMQKIEKHLLLCDNEATALQYEILAQQMPSMLQRIEDAYKNTRLFANYIQEVLPTAKINFVSEELAAQGFTPSVFSLDLPTKGNSPEERENYKRELNLKLINLMITKIPTESKYCVSYGQLKGCYWTIPATSTQGTTKESDKDYIARVALSGNMDLELHKKVFLEFVNNI